MEGNCSAFVDADKATSKAEKNLPTAIHPVPLRVVFCWAEISGYMAACFREVASRNDVTPFFLAFASGRSGSTAGFSDGVTSGLACRLLEPSERIDTTLIRKIVADHQPDVIVLCGWFHGPYSELLSDPAFAKTAFVMAMDTPWWGRPRQWLGRLLLRRRLRRIDRVVVTGERSWQYAIRLGIPQNKIRRGMYGVDCSRLREAFESRVDVDSGDADSPRDCRWPRRFLFTGRFAKEKAVDLLVEAYRRYRADCLQTDGFDSAWPLICCGTGPLAHFLVDQPGLENCGFVQPDEMLDQFARAGVFVLPSRYDPWPLALVEACAAGLPVIATEACGSTVELVRDGFNGFVIATDDIAALAGAMRRAHDAYDELPIYGERSKQFAAAYSAEVWADRWQRILREVLPRT